MQISTTDNSTPTASSTQYTSAIPVTSGSTTIKAIAIKSGFANSSATQATYVITYPVCTTPTFSLAAGTYPSAQTITLTSTAGATIYYTTDGTTPTASSPSVVSGGSFSLTANGVYNVKAFAKKAGYQDSAVASREYTINLSSSAGVNFGIQARNVVLCNEFLTVNFASENEKYLSFEVPESGRDIYLEWADKTYGVSGIDTADVKVTLYENDLATVSNSINASRNAYDTNRKPLTLNEGRYFIKISSNSGGNISGNCRAKVMYKTTIKYHNDVGSGNSIYIMGDSYPLNWVVGQEASWTTDNIWVWETFDMATEFEFKATKGASGQSVGNIWESSDNKFGTPGTTYDVYNVTW